MVSAAAKVLCHNEALVSERSRSRARHAVLLAIGLSLGAGPWRCSLLAPPDAGPGSGAGLSSAGRLGAGAGLLGAGSGTGSGSAAPPLRPSVTAPPPPATPSLSTTPRREEPAPRETVAPRKPAAEPSRRAAFNEDVIQAAMRPLQPTFAACWKRAQRNDPTLTSARIKLSLEVDWSGAVIASRTDALDDKLGACLANVARRLRFPEPGRTLAFDVPLIF
jgi:hypothetical protein